MLYRGRLKKIKNINQILVWNDFTAQNLDIMKNSFERYKPLETEDKQMVTYDDMKHANMKMLVAKKKMKIWNYFARIVTMQ